jgi:hypothetical protein
MDRATCIQKEECKVEIDEYYYHKYCCDEECKQFNNCDYYHSNKRAIEWEKESRK